MKVLCQKALEVLVEESNVQVVGAPVTICKAFGVSISGNFAGVAFLGTKLLLVALQVDQ